MSKPLIRIDGTVHGENRVLAAWNCAPTDGHYVSRAMIHLAADDLVTCTVEEFDPATEAYVTTSYMVRDLQLVLGPPRHGTTALDLLDREIMRAQARRIDLLEDVLAAVDHEDCSILRSATQYDGLDEERTAVNELLAKWDAEDQA